MLDPKLLAIADVLILATSARAEIGTTGFHSQWGRLQHRNQPRARKTLFKFGDLRLNGFARHYKRDKHNKFANSSHPFTPKGDIVDLELVNLTNLECGNGQSWRFPIPFAAIQHLLFVGFVVVLAKDIVTEIIL